MSECPLCDGVGELPDCRVHFGDGVDEPQRCFACRGSGDVNGSSEDECMITIIKPHGVWGYPK